MADPTLLYSLKGASPTTLPHKIRLSDGRSRTDVSTFTDEELTDAGYTGPYTVPSYQKDFEIITWDSSNLALNKEAISNDDLWAGIREKRNRLLAESDWSMTADVPGNKTNLAEWMKYRQRLRDLPTSESDPKLVTWPQSPEGRAPEDFDVTPVVENTARFRIEDLEAELKNLKTEVDTLKTKVAALESA